MRTLKISTLIKGILFFLCAGLVCISLYSLKSMSDASQSVEKLQITLEKLSELRRMSSFLTQVRGDINFLHNDTSVTPALIDRMTAEIRKDLDGAKRHAALFLNKQDIDETCIALTRKIYERFNSLAEAYAGNLQALAAYHNSGFDNARHEHALDEPIEEYAAYSAEFGNQAIVDFRTSRDHFVMVLGIYICIAIATALGSWLMIKRSVFNRLAVAAQMVEKIGTGELYHTFDTGARNEIGMMLESLQNMKNSLTGIISSVRSASELINTDAAEIQQGNENLSARTEKQACAIQQTAASMEEIKTTVASNAENARQANSLAHQARSTADSGADIMLNAVEMMKTISESAKKIFEINSVIDGIANQTNILALNAAVEAARAGEQGRGFSVVATEVRNLAKRSADAAQEINALLNQSLKNVDDGARLVEDAGKTMEEIVTSVTHVSDIMQEITQASEEQNTGVGQISTAVNEMDLATHQNAMLVEESSQIVLSMNQRARQLAETVAVFRLDAQQVQPEAIVVKPTVSAPLRENKIQPASKPAPAGDDWTEF